MPIRILCLHGRGSNTEIFRMQTAGIRSLLEPEYEFVFVEGRWPHLEGNWSLHTVDFSKSNLYGFYNMLDIDDILATENELRQVIEDHGPFDGLLGYSQGGSMAAQIAMRLLIENPYATLPELPIKFLVLINSAVPPLIMPLDEQQVTELPIEEAPKLRMLFDVFKADPAEHLDKARPVKLANGRQVIITATGKALCFAYNASPPPALVNKTHYMTFFDKAWDGHPLSMPSLHVTGQGDAPEYGQQLYDIAEPGQAELIRHVFGHDFPRGLDVNKTIARSIRALAEKAL
ncbi:Ovarian cancer-associated -like protein [Colletotrichum tanaceti]|uniref:Ovarian cancer-associated-like protein n=1 Tax=Colletotrichum tanaceti TaxID=1306861 RepID=A0A4U6XR75_9PEZI|nr:Ovarian cancer-associated -like protein [Colletotrichum tanaceti]TKW58375.1 Ovarian cancer-associated -like protein [Colletotrichum tanaceti]